MLGEAAATFRDRVEQAIAAASTGSAVPAVRRWRWPAMPALPPARWRARWSTGARRACATCTTMAARPRVGVRDGAGDAVHRAQDLGATRHGLLCQEQPLLLGAIGVTVGAALGMLLPSSRYERRDVGRRAREACARPRREAGRDARDRAVARGRSVVDTAQEATRREGLSPVRPSSWRPTREQVADMAPGSRPPRGRGDRRRRSRGGASASWPATASRIGEPRPTVPDAERSASMARRRPGRLSRDREDVLGPGELARPDVASRRRPAGATLRPRRRGTRARSRPGLVAGAGPGVARDHLRPDSR